MQARRLRLAVALGAALIVAAVIGSAWLLATRMRDTALASAADTVQRTSRAVEGIVNRQVLQVDGMLAGLGPILNSFARNSPLDPTVASRVLREVNQQNLAFRDVLLVRPDARPWATALFASRRRLLPVDVVTLDADGGAGGRGALAIAGPARNVQTGEWSLYLARPVDLAGAGPLIGVAEVPLPLLATLLAPVGDSRGLRITLERPDGTLLASLPHDESRIGRQLNPPASELRADGSVSEMPGRFTSAPVLTSARPTLYRGLVVVTTLETAAALAEWREDRTRLVVVAGAAALLLLLLAMALDAALRQRERVEAERAASREVLENALESMMDGFVMWDAEDRLVVANSRYQQMYAISAPFAVPGARFADIIREGALRGQYPQAGDDIDGFVLDLQSWHRGDHPPLERLLPDGRWVLVTERRTPDGGTVGIRTDITMLKRAMSELATARDAAANAAVAKSRFLARMSHELRTPLNGVLGLAQVLAADPTLTPEQREQARTLERAGRHLVAVANDVLDLAQVEAGKLELRPEAVDLPVLLEECAAVQRPAAANRDVAIRTLLAPDLPVGVVADPTRLRQLVHNILSNAVKFSPAGGEVQLRAASLSGNDPSGRAIVRIEVRDTGPGVPPEARHAVFGDFVQLASGAARGGAGLGLAIAAHIASRMEGRIGCDNNAEGPNGTGALFWVELPFALATLSLPAAPVIQAPDRHRRILVVDDVPANIAVARALLTSAGHVVTGAGGGPEAIEAVSAAVAAGRPFDAVLMDMMMPEMDGLEATRRIRALPGEAGRVPILAVTASAFAADVEACLEAGMNGHVAKPIEREVLMEVLRSLPGNEPGSGSDAPPPPAFSDLPLVTRAPDGSVLMIGGLTPEQALSLVPDFLDELVSATEGIRGGGTADLTALTHAAHRLAGAAATLGATRLATAARKLQGDARAGNAEMPATRHLVLQIADATLPLLQEGLSQARAAAAAETVPAL